MFPETAEVSSTPDTETDLHSDAAQLPTLPDPVRGCAWTALQRADLGDLNELIAAIEYVDDPIDTLPPERVREFYEGSIVDPATQGALLRDAKGSPVAYAWNHPLPAADGQATVRSTGGVHPAWRWQGIGTCALSWQCARADAWARSQPIGRSVEQVALLDESAEAAQQLFRAHGFGAERWYFDMHHVFPRGENPPPPAVHGVDFVPFTDELSEAVRAAHNTVFAEFGTVDERSWRASLQRSICRPEWSWVALHRGKVIGYALNTVYRQSPGGSEGWTERLGVVSSWRRRGVARALLSWSMQSFGDAGLDGAGIGFDTSQPDAARELCRSLGYESQEMLMRFTRRAG